MDELTELVTLFKGLVGQESLSEATPFLTEYRQFVLPGSAGLMVIGLALCFFGWRFFKFSTIVGGVFSGFILGIMCGGVMAMIIGSALPADIASWGTPGLFVLIGIPCAIFGAKFGRQFAMFGARAQTLRGLGTGGLGSIFSLTRFAFFDLSVIWGHALVGAILIAIGIYCFAVVLFALPDAQLQMALMASCVLAMPLCIFGVVTQIRHLRSEPNSEYRGEY